MLPVVSGLHEFLLTRRGFGRRISEVAGENLG